jgi:uncharacterized repeat protein (TIGR03847 family)
MTLADFDPPERFVAGTVGPPGQRTFFLQARGGGRVVSMSLEKVQVNVLAERITDVLDAVGDAGSGPAAPPDNDPLDTPIEDAFRVTTMALSWDADREVVVLECHDRDLDETDDEDPAAAAAQGDGQTVRVILRPGPAREFVRRASAVVAAGRPPCPFCGQPLDPDGHICPRANGYRR